MDPALLSHPPSADLHLGIPGFRFPDLHHAARLADLTRAFDASLAAAEPALFARYDAHRAGSARLQGPAESELLLEVGAHLSRFLAKLFGVEKELGKLRDAAGRDAPIFRVKREFVGSDVTRPSGYTTCVGATRFTMKSSNRHHPDPQ